MKKGIIDRQLCPVCSHHGSSTIFRRSFNEPIIKDYMKEAYQGNADLEFLENVYFEIVKCNKCGLSYQKYVLDDERINDLYNKWIDPKLAYEWNQGGDKASLKAFFTEVLTDAQLYLRREPANIKVLDFGAGFGDALEVAIELGFDAYAYEYSVERIRVLQEKGIKIINADTNLKFDFIIVNQILEHITNLEEIIALINSKIDRKGLVYFAVPDCPDIVSKLRNTFNITEALQLKQHLLDASVSAFQHINFFTNKTLRELLQKHHFTPIIAQKPIFTKPYSLKLLLRPFIRYYFRTRLFAKPIK